MSTPTPQGALQDYFDDLLSTGSTAAPEPAAPRPKLAEPAPRPLTQPESTPKLPAYDDDELAALEQSKREKLQALLNSKPMAAAPVSDVAEPTITDEPKAAPAIAEVVEPQEVVAEVSASPAVSEDRAHLSEHQDSVVSQYLTWHENGRPHWAQHRFDALLFDVSGLTLAVPLIALGQIQSLTDELTPLFGQADWFMGLMPTPVGKIRTVNTALFVMPEKYDPGFLQTAKYVVSIDGVPWGLAVDAINQPISLDPDDVKWRSERTKRPWLAGTVKSAMCALIDIPQMGQMLMDADKNYTPR